ncbi:MAG: ThuA domain-containing protein [Clostridia bacterium]|nr:ThuA domain-containing protein [Clostridia bacterium]
MIRVTVWNEFYHEKVSEAIGQIYPDGIHGAIAGFLSKDENLSVRTVTFDDPEYGLSDEVLDSTDVLIWWAHVLHHKVPDEVARRVQDRVLKGMGFIPLHSSHMCKPFQMLLGTSCTLRWRDNDRERLWCVNPGHPIAQGIGEYFELEHEEMYGEFFDIPEPDELIFIGWFKGGEAFRSGCTFRRGYGKIFYFQPGHEEYPTYYNENVQKVIKNAVYWAVPTKARERIDAPFMESPEAGK